LVIMDQFHPKQFISNVCQVGHRHFAALCPKKGNA